MTDNQKPTPPSQPSINFPSNSAEGVGATAPSLAIPGGQPSQLSAQQVAQILAGAQFGQMPPNGAVGGRPGGAFMLPISIGAQAQQTTQWQGPYPPPEAVERYDRVHPGAFDRILSMAERMEAAQIEQSFFALQSARDDNRRGNYLGFALGFLAIIAALVCVSWQQPWVATLFLALPVMGLAKSLAESARSKASVDVQSAQPPVQNASALGVPSATDEGAKTA